METFMTDSNLYRVAEIELTYSAAVKASERLKIACPKDAYAILLKNWNAGRLDFVEEFKIIVLDQASRVLGICDISRGGITSTIADTRLIFAAALKAGAVGIILAHNHPSGQLIPSQADKNMTAHIRTAGDILEIKVLDHLIVTSEGFLSFVDDGLF